MSMRKKRTLRSHIFITISITFLFVALIFGLIFYPLEKKRHSTVIKKIEMAVNQKIWDNLPVVTKVMNVEEAKKGGALAFFGEKYAETVRVVNIEDCSQELCGGTHICATGQIGLFKIIAESSVAQTKVKSPG